MFVATGAAALLIVQFQKYVLGSASKMGPGYFPLLLGAGLMLVGAVLTFRGLSSTGPALKAVNWRSNAFIIAAVVAFGLMIEPLGLVVTVCTGVVLSALAYDKSRWREIIAVAAFMAALSVAVFKYGLAQPLTVWGKLWIF